MIKSTRVTIRQIVLSKMSPNDIVKQLQLLIANWVGFENLLEKELQNLGNLVNEVTYVNPERLTNILGNQSIKLSRFTIPAQKKLNDKLDDLKLISHQMQEELKKIIVKYDVLLSILSNSSIALTPSLSTDCESNLSNNRNSSDACCIEMSIIGRVIHDLKQQTLLEVSVIDNIISTRVQDEWSCSSSNNSNIPDQNELVTLLACFQYKPYLDESLLSRFMNLQVSK